MEKRWFIPKVNPRLERILSQEATLSLILSQILINRKIDTPEQAKAFLSPSLDDLLNPFLMTDMEKASMRIKEAISKGERILIYGDYDVDGVTGTALLLSVLRDLGADVSSYIPNRLREGYGLNIEAIHRLKTQEPRPKLIITVDCGTTSHKEIDLTNSFDIDVIITDHHQPLTKDPRLRTQDSGLRTQDSRYNSELRTHNSQLLPNAYAILNPNREDSAYPFRELAGVGVVFKLCQALIPPTPPFSKGGWGGLLVKGGGGGLERYLDLVALGTIADLVPLIGENRILVKEGLEILSHGERTGIKALKKVAGLEGRPVNSGAVSFCLAPRINAAGRIGDAGHAVRLLLSESEKEAIEIAENLDRLNRERQEIEDEIFGEALERLKTQDLRLKTPDYSIVLASPDWHLGVIGIVASRLVDAFYRPSFLFSIKDGVAKGSARSIPNFHLHEALTECSDLLMGFGGHSYAAGLSLKEEKLKSFRIRIDEIINKTLNEEDLIPRFRIDAKVDFRELTFGLINELDALSPFGLGNPQPVLGAKAVEIISPRSVGNNHLKMKLRQNRVVLNAIGFDMGDLLNRIEEGKRIDIAFTPSINEWEGGKKLQLEIKAIRPHK
jgi:single-stranded-DNA-specific exonuclease